MKRSSTHTSLTGFRNLEHFEETPFFLTHLPTGLNNIQYIQVQSIMVNSLNLLHSQNMPSINLGIMAECPDRSTECVSLAPSSKFQDSTLK